jgi:hypothetical protein
MTKIVKANLACASLGTGRKCDGRGYPGRESFLRRPKDEVVRDIVLACQVSLQQTFVSKLDEYPAELKGEIDPSRFFAFGGGVLAPHLVVLHQDESSGIFVVSAELDVAPLESHQLTAAQPGTHRNQQQGILLREEYPEQPSETAGPPCC